MISDKILPGTGGRWHREAMTEGGLFIMQPAWWGPSTMLRMVPLLVPGRI